MSSCEGPRGLFKAMLMALLILSFIVFLVLFSRLAWYMILKPLGVPEYSPLPLQLLGASLALGGLAGLAWVYKTFPPLLMLCRTISDLPETIKAILNLPRARQEYSTCEKRIEIVAEGPYQCVKHPLYSSVILALLGASIAAPWLLPSLAIALPAYYLLSLAEERVLDSRTCGAYSRAMKGKPILNPLRLLLCMVGRLLGGSTRSS